MLDNDILENVEIIDAGSNGKAIGKYNSVVIFIPFAAPGDIVDAKIVKRENNFYEGRIVRVKRFSDKRVKPFCSHYGICGGCHWQHLIYADQLHYKRKTVIDSFIRVGRFPFPEVAPIVPSKEAIFYRNKIEYTFCNKRWFSKDEINRDENFSANGLGFYIPNKFDRVLDIKYCYLQKEPSNEIRLAIKDFAEKHNFDFYDVKHREGFLRNIIIRNSSKGEWMVIVVFNYFDKMKTAMLLDFIANNFPEVSSLFYVVNDTANDIITNLDVELYKGNPYMIEEMEDLKFRLGPLSFYQTNYSQAYELYKIARKYAYLTGEEIVYDLYTGIGTIALFVASKAKKVIGVEFNEYAIKDAKENAKLNNIDNVDFYCGDMMNILTEDFFLANGRPDVIITDPPRNGMHKKVVEQIKRTGVKRIVYISCNPATQARDLVMFLDKYNITKVHPVDMFPQTYHVENIVLLEKKEF